jgi:hypothetical protein
MHYQRYSTIKDTMTYSTKSREVRKQQGTTTKLEMYSRVRLTFFSSLKEVWPDRNIIQSVRYSFYQFMLYTT